MEKFSGIIGIEKISKKVAIVTSSCALTVLLIGCGGNGTQLEGPDYNSKEYQPPKSKRLEGPDYNSAEYQPPKNNRLEGYNY